MYISCVDDGVAVEAEMGYVPNNPLFGLPLDSPQVNFEHCVFSLPTTRLKCSKKKNGIRNQIEIICLTKINLFSGLVKFIHKKNTKKNKTGVLAVLWRLHQLPRKFINIGANITGIGFRLRKLS